MGDYYRIPMDDRDLNYAKYFSEGDEREAELDDFHSHNTTRLGISEIEALLRTLPEIQGELARAGH
jgi:UDP-N-acetylglucosamine 4,6-dehydratase/5-epimerase